VFWFWKPLILHYVVLKDVCISLTISSNCERLNFEAWIAFKLHLLTVRQVVTIATYSFFLAALVGRQYVAGANKPFQMEIDTYIPVFTILQFFFFMGLLKVSSLCNLTRSFIFFFINQSQIFFVNQSFIAFTVKGIVISLPSPIQPILRIIYYSLYIFLTSSKPAKCKFHEGEINFNSDELRTKGESGGFWPEWIRALPLLSSRVQGMRAPGLRVSSRGSSYFRSQGRPPLVQQHKTD